MVNPAKFPDTGSSDIIPCPSWIKQYSKIFLKVNYTVHKHFSWLLKKNCCCVYVKRHVIPVEKSAIVKGTKSLKSKPLDLDGISVLNLVPNFFWTGISSPTVFFKCVL